MTRLFVRMQKWQTKQPMQRGFFSFQGSPRFEQVLWDSRANLRFREVARIEPDAYGLKCDKCQKIVIYVALVQQINLHILANPWNTAVLTVWAWWVSEWNFHFLNILAGQ